MDIADLWLIRTRAKSTHANSQAVIEYLRLRDAGLVPPGVALYVSRSMAKQASKFASDHPSRPVPKGLQPVAVTPPF